MVRIFLFLLLSLVLSISNAFATIELDADNNGAIDISKGGTNAQDAAAARTNIGAGDVSGPSSVTDSSIVVFNGTTGKSIKAENCSVVSGVITCERFETSAGDGGRYLRFVNTNDPTITCDATTEGAFAYNLTLGKLRQCNGSTWEDVATSGGGDVTGPASSTDSAITVFDGTTGKVIKAETCTVVSGVLTCDRFETSANDGGRYLRFVNTNDPSITCDSSTEGTFAYNLTTHTLRQCNGTSWEDVAGDVSGPSSATDSQIAVFDGASGKTIKAEACTVINGVLTCDEYATNAADGERYIRIANTNDPTVACNSSIAGAFAYNITLGKFRYCNGSAWADWPGSGGTTTYTLTVTDPGNNDAIQWDIGGADPIDCGNGQTDCDTTQTAGTVISNITAVPATGREFVAWSGDITGLTASDGTVTLDANKTGSATFQASTGSGVIIGQENDGGTSSGDGGAVVCSQYAATASGTIINMGFWSDAADAGSGWAIGIYSDDAGEVGTLLGTTDAQTGIVVGLNTAALQSGVALTGGTNYWLCHWGGNSGGSFGFLNRDTTGGNSRDNWSAGDVDVANWPAGSTFLGSANTYVWYIQGSTN